ncbi:hypothetical protein [Pseudaminobacter soli (ex Li et al. 2025)]|uniref:Uncharacterized protein n=1 Tax=Pseudaminobacter soli (ex Li et al. 2025) TaxID=1295366 RepID=A0A2P7RZV1_9HYPH|nr:hypothetical protein [Mesorhizobium soli]PSJ55758.1 hypothetical protein C7I85_26060 [Mesorhizobium soli]
MFHVAWVDPSETTFGPEHVREDEDVLAFEITHAEGDFASLALDIRNPRIGLLASGREVWLWFSWTDDANPAGGARELFLGRLVGVPEAIHEDAVRLTFTARPQGFDATKEALAETLKVRPYWDPIFVREDRRDDPDSVLESRTQLWHIDRITHDLTVSDILAGEDGTIEVGGNFFRDSLDVRLSSPPARQVEVEAELSWDQIAAGNIDLTARLARAARAAGAGNGYSITTLTGEGLMRDWPQEGRRIGGGWEFGPCSVERLDGTVSPLSFQSFEWFNGVAKFPLWTLKPVLTARYDVTRKRVERVKFTLHADCQALLTEPGDEEILKIAVASDDVGNPVDPADTDHPDGVIPIGDLRRRAYLPTERGRRSLEYLICLARAQLLVRSRAVEISFAMPFEDGLDLSCRKNASIIDDRLPGGRASGKIIAYSLSGDGDSGEFSASVTMGCTIGRGNTVTTVPGTPSYVEEGYVEDGWQVRADATVMPIAGEVTYAEFGNIAPNDDGVDFFNLRADDVILDIAVYNGESIQRDVIAEFPGDLEGAKEALNEVYTEVYCSLKPLKGGPFETEYPITVSDLMAPKTIDLEAGAV